MALFSKQIDLANKILEQNGIPLKFRVHAGEDNKFELALVDEKGQIVEKAEDLSYQAVVDIIDYSLIMPNNPANYHLSNFMGILYGGLSLLSGGLTLLSAYYFYKYGVGIDRQSLLSTISAIQSYLHQINLTDPSTFISAVNNTVNSIINLISGSPLWGTMALAGSAGLGGSVVKKYSQSIYNISPRIRGIASRFAKHIYRYIHRSQEDLSYEIT
jgi:hypothetical protein